jgi:CHAT domain-containing protein/tetratricopeptide (TPR) repeat protein
VDETTSTAYSLMEKLTTSQHLPLAREGLCRLLKLDIVEVQQEAIRRLKPFLHLSYLAYDVENRQSEQLIALEKQVSEIIAWHVRSSSLELLFPLLDIYQDILERLWLLPYLIEDRSSYAVIIEKNSPLIYSCADQWMGLLIQEKGEDKEFILVLKSLQGILQRIHSSSPIFAEKISGLKPHLDSLIIPSLLGNLYREAGDAPRAIQHYQANLDLIAFAKIKEVIVQNDLKGGILNSLRDIYNSLGECRKAIDCYEVCLQIAQESNNREWEGVITNNLGNAYQSLGETRKAIDFHKKSLQIAQEIGARILEGGAYGSLGNAYQSLGEARKAIDFYKKSLQTVQALGNRILEGGAYGGFGNAYQSLGKYRKAINAHEQHLQIAQSIGDRAGEGRAYNSLGNIYNSLGETQKAIDYHEKSLQTAQALGDRILEGGAYVGLGNAYFFLKEYRKAIDYYEKSLQVAQAIGNHEGEGISANNLGLAYEFLGEIQKATEYFRHSIIPYSILQDELGDNHQWKISIFEQQANAYLGLERVLLNQSRVEEALEITDSRRSRALVSSLSKRLLDGADVLLPFAPLSAPQIKILAQKLQTTFVVYSLSLIANDEKNISAWIIPPQGEIVWQPLSTDALPDNMREASKLFKVFPFISGPPTRPSRPTRGETFFDSDPISLAPPIISFLEEMQELYRGGQDGVSTTQEKFKERLTQWYESLIAPIEAYLPQNPKQTLTIIPDGFLSQVPFAAFRDSEGKYLIEKHPLSIAPSIQVLHLLNQLPKGFSPTSLVIGNPTTPHPKEALAFAEKEAKEIVAPLLHTPIEKILAHQAPTVTRTLEEACQVCYIHLACHGVTNEDSKDKPDPHSVFEGLFKLAPDEKHPNGYLHSQEIASLSLQANLVFMSACFSGRGRVQREGSIGPIWSFLAAGALSTVATYWRLPDSELTLQIVEAFYRHLLGRNAEKLNKARALQQAMLKGIEKERENPHKWAAFFLSGLST